MALSIAANTLVSTLGRVLGLVISLVTLGYTASYLKPEGYGDYAAALAFGFIFNALADLGLYAVLVREISKAGANAWQLVSAALSLRLLALIVLMAAAVVAAWQFPYAPSVKAAIMVMAIFYIFSSLTQVLMAVFQRQLRTDRAAVAEIIGRLAQLGLVLLFIWLKAGLLGMAAALALSALVGLGAAVYFARKFVAFSLIWDPAAWRRLLKEAWPIALALVFVVVYFKLDTVILSLYHPGADVGIYNLAYQLLQAVIFFPAMFAGLVMPFLSRHGLKSPGEFQQTFSRTLNLFIVFTLPLGVLLMARAADIIKIIDFSSQYPAAGPVLQILALAIMAIYFGSLFANGLIALHRQRALLWIYGSGAALNVALNLWLIPRYSYWAASWTTVATEVLVTAFMVASLAYFSRRWFSWARLLPVAAASLAAALLLLLTASWSIFLAAPLAAALYLSSLWLLGGLTRADLAFIRQSKLS